MASLLHVAAVLAAYLVGGMADLAEADEFLLLTVQPEGALTASSLGAQGVEEDDIGQVNLWMVRGGIERR